MSEEATLDEFTDTAYSDEWIDTPIGELPGDWAVEWLNDMTDINPDGFSKDDWPSETFEYIPLSEASGGKILGSETVSLDEAPSRAQRQIQQGDVLVGTVRPKQVSHGFVTAEHDGKICSSGFGVLRTGPNLNSHYLMQEVLSNRFFSQMEAYVAGSGYPAIKINDLKKHRVAIPPLEEQQKIATVLYTVDQAIQKTEEIIEQVKNVKRGSTQELFRQGLYEHETDSRRLLGEIPKDWDIVTIGELCEKVTDGTHRAVPAQESGKPCLTAKNIRDWGFNLDDIKYISEDEHEDIISRCYPEKGDLLYVKDGANTGMVQVNTLDFEFSLLNSVILMKVDEEKIDPLFLEQMLSWEKMKKLIVARRTGTGIRRVTITNMEKSEVVVPSLEEQREISDILATFDKRIVKEMELRKQFQRFKRGLMQDLLSGTVRTTNADIDVPNEITQYG